MCVLIVSQWYYNDTKIIKHKIMSFPAWRWRCPLTLDLTLLLSASGPPGLNMSSSLMTDALPLAAAMCAQVAPSMLASVANSGLCLRNSFTTSEWSLSAARWRGVWPCWNTNKTPLNHPLSVSYGKNRTRKTYFESIYIKYR